MWSKRERVAIHATNAVVLAITVGAVTASLAAICGAWLAYAFGVCVGQNFSKEQP